MIKADAKKRRNQPCHVELSTLPLSRDTRYVQLIDQPQTMMHFIKKIPKKQRQRQQPEMTNPKKEPVSETYSSGGALRQRQLNLADNKLGAWDRVCSANGNPRRRSRGVRLSAGQVLTHQPNPVKCTKTYKCLKNIMSRVDAGCQHH